MDDIPGPWREYEEPERATSKPLIPTMITNDELDKLRRKYLRMRAEISGLSLKEESNQQRVIHFHMTFLTESRTFSIKATRVILQAKVGRIGLKDLKNPENPHHLDLDLGF